MGAVRGLGGLALLGRELEVIANVDPLDHEDPILILDLARPFGPEPPLAGRNPARLQRRARGCQ